MDRGSRRRSGLHTWCVWRLRRSGFRARALLAPQQLFSPRFDFTPLQLLEPSGCSRQLLAELLDFLPRRVQILAVRLSLTILGRTFLRLGSGAFTFWAGLVHSLAVGLCFLPVLVVCSTGPGTVALSLERRLDLISRRLAHIIASALQILARAFNRLPHFLIDRTALLDGPSQISVSLFQSPAQVLYRYPFLFKRLMDFTHGLLQSLADLLADRSELLAELADQILHVFLESVGPVSACVILVVVLGVIPSQPGSKLIVFAIQKRRILLRHAFVLLLGRAPCRVVLQPCHCLGTIQSLLRFLQLSSETNHVGIFLKLLRDAFLKLLVAFQILAVEPLLE